MNYTSIEDLRSHLGQQVAFTPEYRAKMLHDIPAAIGVDRTGFILERAKGQFVLEFGASGTLHRSLLATTRVRGVDKNPGDDSVGAFDLDDCTKDSLPIVDGVELIVCGEIIEHLGNPGYFLQRLKRQYDGIPAIITVPNAYNKTGRKWLRKETENVNVDHVAWYSHRTLKTLLERYGYEIQEFYWYDGNDAEADGIVVVAR